MKKRLIINIVFLILVVSASLVYGKNETNSECKNLYWFDSENKNCSQQEFCGLYMYQELQTFESETQCLKALNGSQERKNITFVPWQKRNESECLQGCKCVGAVISCLTETGKIMNITAGRSGNVITIIVDKTEANTSLELKQETIENKTKLKAHLSNGRKAEIKIMPETASERAIERLGELNFTIQLKEVGKGEDAKAVYELESEKEGRMLGLFKIRAKVSMEVDAETGEVVKAKKPWWSFLASGI